MQRKKFLTKFHKNNVHHRYTLIKFAEMNLLFWKKTPSRPIPNEDVEFDISEINMSELNLMLKFGQASNQIGYYESKPLIELPYGMVKIQVPELLKNENVLEAVDEIMRFQFNDFDISKVSGNEIIYFLLWIKEQLDRINKIENQFLQTDPEPEMLAAGLMRLNEFGEDVTIDALAKGNILEYEKIKQIPYFEVYKKLKLDKTQRDIEKKYNKILEEKNRTK